MRRMSQVERIKWDRRSGESDVADMLAGAEQKWVKARPSIDGIGGRWGIWYDAYRAWWLSPIDTKATSPLADLQATINPLLLALGGIR